MMTEMTCPIKLLNFPLNLFLPSLSCPTHRDEPIAIMILPPLSPSDFLQPSHFCSRRALTPIRLLALIQTLGSLILDIVLHWHGGRWLTYFTHLGHAGLLIYYIAILTFNLHNARRVTYVLHTLAVNVQLLIPIVYWSMLAGPFLTMSGVRQYLSVSSHLLATIFIVVESACNKVIHSSGHPRSIRDNQS